jgi:hypothetical protein
MFVNSFLPFLNKNMYSQPVKVAVLPLQLLVHHATAPHHSHSVGFAGCLSNSMMVEGYHYAVIQVWTSNSKSKLE